MFNVKSKPYGIVKYTIRIKGTKTNKTRKQIKDVYTYTHLFTTYCSEMVGKKFYQNCCCLTTQQREQKDRKHKNKIMHREGAHPNTMSLAPIKMAEAQKKQKPENVS